MNYLEINKIMNKMIRSTRIIRINLRVKGLTIDKNLK